MPSSALVEMEERLELEARGCEDIESDEAGAFRAQLPQRRRKKGGGAACCLLSWMPDRLSSGRLRPTSLPARPASASPEARRRREVHRVGREEVAREDLDVRTLDLRT